MTENLDQLRQVAERATPGPWEKRELPVSVGNSTCTIHAPNAVGIPTWSPLPPEIAGILKHEDATHIATFDPPTVLAMLDRAEAAEAAVQRVREKHFPDENGDCDFCVNYYCDTRKAEYPCPTIRTLDGGEQE